MALRISDVPGSSLSDGMIPGIAVSVVTFTEQSSRQRYILKFLSSMYQWEVAENVKRVIPLANPSPARSTLEQVKEDFNKLSEADQRALIESVDLPKLFSFSPDSEKVSEEVFGKPAERKRKRKRKGKGKEKKDEEAEDGDSTDTIDEPSSETENEATADWTKEPPKKKGKARIGRPAYVWSAENSDKRCIHMILRGSHIGKRCKQSCDPETHLCAWHSSDMHARPAKVSRRVHKTAASAAPAAMAIPAVEPKK